MRKFEGDALQAKLAEQSFEGELYRGVSALLKNNKEIIEKAKPKVEKNSSGYALWDIGDGVNSLNFARLMVGSQGTLGSSLKSTLRSPPQTLCGDGCDVCKQIIAAWESWCRRF